MLRRSVTRTGWRCLIGLMVHLLRPPWLPRRTPDQVRRLTATWEMRRTPRVPDAEFTFKGDFSVSMYLRVIVREVVFLAPMLGWKDPDRMAADFAFTFVCKHNLSAEKITAARLSS